jgi:CHAT domain-containing protein
MSYFKTRDFWRLFLITSTDYSELDLGNIKVDETVQHFRKALQSGQDTRNFEEQLYEDLIAKAQSRLPGSGLSLIIVPYGPLHYIPFSALYSKTSKQYLIQQHVIRTVPSASILEYLIVEPRPEQGILVLGNPYRPDQIPLPGAEQEARLIASRLKPSDLFLDKEATKPRFLELAPRHQYLHIAGHGKFDADEPLRSQILLAPPNIPSKDQGRSGQLPDYSSGNLEANDLFKIKEPWDARLVVLMILGKQLNVS